MLAAFPRLGPPTARYYMEPTLIWPFALSILMLPTLRRGLIGVVDPRPRRVQAAVKQSLFSLIVLDAAVCLLVCPWPYALGVLALLLPAILLGRWVYST